ncbi:hypothetical protein VOLCADRAFT_56392, partial [Volvox carteri f. nagariensis]
RWVVAVACTTLKGGRAEWLVEKLTELGAFMMIPLVTERSQVGMTGRGCTAFFPNRISPGRLERVAIAATKQSLRPHVLHLAPPTALADVLPDDGGGESFCLIAVAGAPPLATRGCDAAGESEGPLRVLFIGPEGDFTPAELAALVQAGARPVGLGTNRLRTETAAIGLLAACLLTEDEGAEDELRWA